MTVLYADYRTYSVSVGETGHNHVRADAPAPGDRTPMAVDCDACEPYLRRMGWVPTPHYQGYRRRADGTLEPQGKGIPLTDEQLDEIQQREDEAQAAVREMGERLVGAAKAAAVVVPPRTRRARS